MSFGKRGVAPLAKGKARADYEPIQRETRAPRDGETIFDAKLLLQLLKVLGVFAVCYLGYNFVLPEILALTVGHPVTGMVPPRSPEGRALRQKAIERALAARSTEVRQIEIRLDEACMPRGAQTIHTPLDQVEYWVDPESKWAPDAQDPRGQMEIREAPAYLSCVSRMERRRFCQPYFQAKFASQLKRYFESLATYNATAEKLKAAGLAEYAKTIDLDPAVVAIVKDLSSNGYLSASNFGSFGRGVPKEIAPFMQPQSRSNCQ